MPIKLIKTHHLQDICVNNVCFYIFDISPSFYLFSSIIWEKGDGVKCPTTLVKYQIFNELELIICLGHELGCVAHDSCGLSL